MVAMYEIESMNFFLVDRFIGFVFGRVDGPTVVQLVGNSS